MTFDTTYEFEAPLVLGNGEYSIFTGVAHLELDSVGGTDYGFIITALTLEGTDKNLFPVGININEKHDSVLCRELFKCLSTELYKDTDMQDDFAEKLAEARFEGVA